MFEHYCLICGQLIEDYMDLLLEHLEAHGININDGENEELGSDEVVSKYYQLLIK
jgi:hypothetical protein